jgi:formate hydrogenlyase transcriptional activator
MSQPLKNGAMQQSQDNHQAWEKALNGSNKSEPRLFQIIDAIPVIAWCNSPDGSSEFQNQRWLDYTGIRREAARGERWKIAIHPDDFRGLAAKWETLLVQCTAGECDARLRRSDGVFRWFLFRIEPIRDETGEVVQWYGTAIDIDDRKRTESLRDAEKRMLEMIANGARLSEVLNGLCAAIDSHAPGATSFVCLMDSDGKHLQPCAGPRVPAAFTKAITPFPIGPNRGSCGTAAFTKERVIIPDISSDPKWPDEIRNVALEHGVRAAWSEPLISKDGHVLGTFCVSYGELRNPDSRDIELIEAAANIALIAIERERYEEELRRIPDAIPNAIVMMNPDGSSFYANKALLDYTGLSMDEARSADFRTRVFHPEDIERVRESRRKSIIIGAPFENEQRVLGKDGKYRWYLHRYNPFRDAQGRLVRWYTTGTDIDDRKRSEERMRNENIALREDIVRSSLFEEIVGSSESLRRVLVQVSKVAPTDSTVLILGETGTGKELIARAIHNRSKRSARAFIRVNCAAIPPSLIASELFGHEKGSFTGALQRRLGRFESADGGTLFLDEVGELPLETQVALLRVLQERELERVGGSQTVSVDVRVIAATNRDLSAAVAEKIFREDLFYRLNVFPIRLPALRDRADDIPLLVEYLIDRYATKAGKRIRKISKDTLTLFRSYHWPGNIRELQNVIERAVILCEGETFTVEEAWFTPVVPKSAHANVPLVADLVEREKEMIENALRETMG